MRLQELHTARALVSMASLRSGRASRFFSSCRSRSRSCSCRRGWMARSRRLGGSWRASCTGSRWRRSGLRPWSAPRGGFGTRAGAGLKRPVANRFLARSVGWAPGFVDAAVSTDDDGIYDKVEEDGSWCYVSHPSEFCDNGANASPELSPISNDTDDDGLRAAERTERAGASPAWAETLLAL